MATATLKDKTPTTRARRAAATPTPPTPPTPHATFRHGYVTVKPSTLPPALTGFVCDALAIAAKQDMAWNWTARFVGHVRLTVGTALAYDPALAGKLFDEAGGAEAFRCFGPYDGRGHIEPRAIGSGVLRQFAGLDPDDRVDTHDLVQALFAMLTAK